MLLHDNTSSHTANAVKETTEAFSEQILADEAYSPDLALSGYHLFASMGHALAQKALHFFTKKQQFFWCGIHK